MTTSSYFAYCVPVLLYLAVVIVIALLQFNFGGASWYAIHIVGQVRCVKMGRVGCRIVTRPTWGELVR